MRNFSFATSIIISFLFLIVPSTGYTDTRIGAPAPLFVGEDALGNTHDLKDYRGKIVVLEWTNPECPYVVKHYETGNMQRLQKQYTERGVIWLTVNSSAMNKQGNMSSEQAQSYISEKGAAPSAYLIDSSGTIGKMYGAKTTPHMFIVNSAGELAYTGAIDDNSSSRHSSIEGAQNYVAEALDALLESKPIQTASTRAYGCSVKYGS
ncbi:MAG: thioredoxin family protein [Bdellovibrionota bacterium]